MAQETSKKRPAKPFTGTEGKTFSKENQPDPKAKSDGWKKRRAEMLLSKAIAEALGVETEDKAPLKQYGRRLIELAKDGNTEAMKQVRSAVEDVVDKVDLTTDGEKIQQQVIILPNGATLPIG